ncbi:MAG: hypothetical protein ACREYC_07140 [Gammaproteobacteria bacterium]
MRGKIQLSFFCLLAASLFASPLFACHKVTQKCPKPPQAQPKKPFDVYVETFFKNQPDFAKYGAKDGRTHLGMIYEGSMFAKGSDRKLLPSKSKTLGAIQDRYKNFAGLFAIDIESWPLYGSDAQTAANVQKFLTVLGWIKTAIPNATVGYYGVVPINGYSATQVSETHPRHQLWRERNDRIVALGKAVEATFPSLYPVDSNSKGWVRYAVGNIKEARRLSPGKKVYPFINPRYHSRAKDSSGKDISFDRVPYDFFLLQLETLKQHADGVVIWDGSRREWNANEPWWLATRKFLGK